MDKERKVIIYKELKRRMNMLKEQGYEVVFIALQGSQNYNMDMYTEDYKSDIDCFACILPTFDDFVKNKQPISTTQVLDNNEHIGLKDIRLLFELFRKQNQQYLELLFTDYKIVNKKYKSIVQPLFTEAENIAKINKKNLYNAIAGTAMNKFVALEHPYPSIKDKIEKYGYDGKQLHHLIRLSQFIHNLDDGMTFKESLTYFNGLVEMMCRNAKLNKYPIEEARLYATNTLEKVKEVANSVGSCEDNEYYVKLLTSIKERLMKQFFKEQLQVVPKKEYDLETEINSYPNVFIISDTHFGHINVLDFEPERLFMLGVQSRVTEVVKYLENEGFTNEEIYNIPDDLWDKYASIVSKHLIEKHDNKLIENWNNVVGKEDLVLILGDFSFSKAGRTMEILKQLNGDKVLIEGNHDLIYLKDNNFDRSLFKAIYTYKEVKYRLNHLVLMHYPIQHYKHEDKPGWYHLFGHIHSRDFEIPKNSYNVGVDVNNYTPIPLDLAIQKAEENMGGIINGNRGRKEDC